MKSAFQVFIILALSALLCNGQCRDDSKSQDVQTVGHAIADFTWNIYKEYISEKPKSNLILSGLSVETVMALVSEGAKGDTRTETLQVLHLPDNDPVIQNGFQKLLENYEMKNVTLDIANAGFLDKSFSVNEKFKSVAEDYFLAEFHPVDFAENAEESRQEINNWAANNTNNLIKEMYKKDSISPNTQLILLNAVYFFGLWDSQFNKDLTRKEPFYTIDGTYVDVDMMALEGHFAYREADDLNAKIIEIPYKGSELSMVVVLPNERDGLPNVESKVTGYESMSAGNARTLVHLRLPRFKISSTLSLLPILSKMNMKQIFSNAADLSGISNSSKLSISDVKQRAVIIVNEEGTEAAAVTGVMVGFSAVRFPQPQIFIADHSFLYYIHHTCTDTILFAGRFTKPE